MLYPQIKTNYNDFIKTEDGHKIYYEESGNANGYPVIYCHGGPGGGSSPFVRRLFDPEYYRIIQFDQRGCGLSEPFMSLHNNTTAHLINDIELLRKQLSISKMLLAGGSWGTTLALLYGQQYPQHVAAFLLRGIFLARQQDLFWLYSSHGAARLFSDYYRDFNPHPCDDPEQLINTYYRRLTSDNELDKLSAARNWCQWESRISVLHADHTKIEEDLNPHHALAMALLESHYFSHSSFIKENQIIANIDKIKDIPATIIHGRYDSVCDFSQADLLNQSWPASALICVGSAGHSLKEKAISEAFCKASNSMAVFLKGQKSKL
ncbi:prolyl aminopeptidase [Gayadomonas joobiniege]|uniref:prolyl aminopeptidase n=1 Tax=Gayadomonas joobiniege TaxID=1234606 RepID=UPI00035EBA84|nr:prolyl aminopeptidase [Gayadomonas joobiniege]